jgi:transposase-like protein
MKKNKSWGGHRPNSGRKTEENKPKVKVTISVSPEVKSKLNQLAQETGLSVSAIANKLLSKHL